MLQKIFRDFFILFGLAALSASTSRPFMKYVVEKRDGNKWWSVGSVKGGNLAVLSGLTFLNQFYCDIRKPIRCAAFRERNNTALYLHGDSYTWSLRDSNFAGLADFHFLNRYDGGHYHLDTSKKNILIIAVTEIWVRKYFSDLRMINEVLDTENPLEKTVIPHSPYHALKTNYSSLFSAINIDFFFNKHIAQNLQYNLFNYNFMVGLFESKAAINYYLFDRAAGDVEISKDKKFLFYKTSVSLTDTGSSYFPLLSGEKKLLVNNLNKIYEHYKAEGFNEVYLSMIPNTASIVQPEGYNNLIPLIETDMGLKMKIIDVYYTFKNSERLLFFHGDSHWNLEGKQKWVDTINYILTQKAIDH